MFVFLTKYLQISLNTSYYRFLSAIRWLVLTYFVWYNDSWRCSQPIPSMQLSIYWPVCNEAVFYNPPQNEDIITQTGLEHPTYFPNIISHTGTSQKIQRNHYPDRNITETTKIPLLLRLGWYTTHNIKYMDLFLLNACKAFAILSYRRHLCVSW